MPRSQVQFLPRLQNRSTQLPTDIQHKAAPLLRGPDVNTGSMLAVLRRRGRGCFGACSSAGAVSVSVRGRRACARTALLASRCLVPAGRTFVLSR